MIPLRCHTPTGLFVLLCVVLCLPVACNGDWERRQREGVLANQLVLLVVANTTYGLKDNLDGTVTWQEFLFRELRASVIYKKCAQGQVWRSTQNDCQGTGSAGNGYGVQALQYCDQNTNACNAGAASLTGAGNSEVYASCNADTTAGRSWRLIASPGRLFHPSSGVNGQLTVPEGQYWADATYTAETAAYYALPYASGRHPKTDRKYVICEAK